MEGPQVRSQQIAKAKYTTQIVLYFNALSSLLLGRLFHNDDKDTLYSQAQDVLRKTEKPTNTISLTIPACPLSRA